MWLSKTPDVISKELDSSEPRTVTYGKFLDNKTGKHLFFFSTHLDYIGDKAREQQVEILISTIKKVAGNSPVIIVGDFNCTSDSSPITKMKTEFTRD